MSDPTQLVPTAGDPDGPPPSTDPRRVAIATTTTTTSSTSTTTTTAPPTTIAPARCTEPPQPAGSPGQITVLK